MRSEYEIKTTPIDYPQPYESMVMEETPHGWLQALVVPIIHWVREMRQKNRSTPTIESTIIKSGKDPKELDLWISPSDAEGEIQVMNLNSINKTMKLLNLTQSFNWVIFDSNEVEIGSGTCNISEDNLYSPKNGKNFLNKQG